MTPARRLPNLLADFPWMKAAIVVSGLFYLWVAAASVAHAQNDFGTIGLPKILAIAIAPICIFCALRYPVIFPFGLYIALAPFDALMSTNGSASLVRFVAFAVVGALGLRMLRLRRMLVPHTGWYVWFAFIIYASISLLWTADFDNGTRVVNSVVLLFLLMTLLAVYPITEREFTIILVFVSLSGLCASLYCVQQFYHGAVNTDPNARLELGGNGFSLDVNYLAGSFIMPIAFVLSALLFSKNLLLRLAAGVSVLPLMFGIFTTASREAVLAAAGIFVYSVIKSKHRIVALFVGIGAIGSIAFFPNILNRLFEQDMANGSGRTDIWKSAMHSFPDHWLFGAGVGSYQNIYDRGILDVAMGAFPGWHRPGHSIVFVSLNDFGVLGSLIVLAAWWTSFRQLRVIPRTSPLYRYRIACEGALIGLGIQMLFLDPFYIKYVWFAHSLSLVLVNLYDPRSIGFGRHARIGSPFTRSQHAPRGA